MIRFFRHYIPVSMVLLTLVEFLVFSYLSVFTAGRYGTAAFPIHGIGGEFKPWLFASILALMNSTFGLYDWEWTKGLRSMLLRTAGSLVACAAILSLGASLLPDAFPSGAEFLAAIFMAFFTSVLIRLLFMEWDKTDLFKKRILILGAGSRAAKIESLIETGEAQGLHIVGYLPLGASHHYVSHDRVVPDQGTLFQVATHHKVEEIVVDPQVLVTLQGKTKFAQLSGVASIVKDRALVDRLWKEDWKVWFPKGKDDPSLCLIAVDPERGEYWDNSGAKGLAYLYRAAKAYLQGTRPGASRDQAAKVQL